MIYKKLLINELHRCDFCNNVHTKILKYVDHKNYCEYCFMLRNNLVPLRRGAHIYANFINKNEYK